MNEKSEEDREQVAASKKGREVVLAIEGRNDPCVGHAGTKIEQQIVVKSAEERSPQAQPDTGDEPLNH